MLSVQSSLDLRNIQPEHVEFYIDTVHFIGEFIYFLPNRMSLLRRLVRVKNPAEILFGRWKQENADEHQSSIRANAVESLAEDHGDPTVNLFRVRFSMMFMSHLLASR